MQRILTVFAALALFAMPAGAQTVTPAATDLSPTAVSGQYNVNATTLPHWRAALARVRAGTGRARLVIIGDSTTAGAGTGSGGTANYNGAFAKTWPRAAATLLGTAIPTSDNSFFCSQNQQAASYPLYDPRVAMGTGWSNTPTTLGGAMFKFTAGSAGTLSFTPTGQIDTIKIIQFQQSGNGTFTVNVDGGASLGTVNGANAVQQLNTATFTVAKAAHTINLVAVNDAAVFVLGVIAYDSTVPAVDVVQTAIHGGLVANFLGTAAVWSPQPALTYLAPDLTVIALTINDSNGGSTLPTYTANMQTLATTALGTGDALFVVGPPSNTAQATNGTLDSYIAALKSIAVANNSGVVDLKMRWVSYAVTNPLMPYFDTLHPMAVAHQDIAQAIGGAIRRP